MNPRLESPPARGAPSSPGDAPPVEPEVLIKEARRHQRRRWLVSVVALLAIGGLVGGLVGSNGPRPPSRPKASGREPSGPHRPPPSALADVSATPPRWAALPLAGLQISVPGSWEVETPSTQVCGALVGLVHYRASPSPSATCATTPNVVWMSQEAPAPSGVSKSVEINGVSVTLWNEPSAGTEVARALGVTVTIRGPFSSEILRTITHSPRSVVLGPYVAAVPDGWRHVSYAGLSVSVPARWTPKRSASLGGCTFNLPPTVLVLSTAKSLASGTCIAPPTTATRVAARPAMVIAAGPRVDGMITARQTRTPGCLVHNRLRVCIWRLPPLPGSVANPTGVGTSDLTAAVLARFDWTSYPGDLAVSVFVPGHRHPVLVEFGLSGSGVTPLEIFDSMRPVST